ncbi:MAG TPA: pitrilysin family protein, partial [Opitutales bacterium]|nr:pitrilysin family protein [Opitutales bacterium]
AEVQAAGGNINAYTTFDRTVYYIDGPAESAPLFLDVLADMVFAPLLDAAEAARERDVILREIDMGKDDPHHRVMEGLFALAFRQHPYRYPVIGVRALFEGLTREDIAAYHAARYAPNNAVVVLSGALNAAEARALIEKHFGALKPQRLPSPAIAAESPQLAPRRQTEYGDVNVVRGVAAYRVPHLAHPDAPALDILALALGGGQASILWQKLREEKKLVHHIQAGNWNPGEAGLCWISYQCDPGKRAEVEAALAVELARVAQKGVTEEMVARARRQILVSEVDSRRSVGGQAARLGQGEVVLGDLDYPRIYFQRLAKVRAAEVKAAAARYLISTQSSAIALEPEAARTAPDALVPSAEGWPDFEEIKFANGARLLLQPGGALPKIHVRTAIQGGPCYEDPAKRGVTSLLATLLTRDAGGRSALAVAKEIENAGALWHEHAGNNSISLAFEALAGDLPLGARTLRAALWKPDFVTRTLEVERESQLAELREEDDEIVDYGMRILRRKFFHKHPLNVSSLGTVETVKTLTVDDVRRHHRALVCGPNLVVAVAGRFERAQALDLLGPVLEAAPRGPFTPQMPAHRGAAKAAEFTEKLDREQTVVFDAYPDAGATAADYLAGEVVDELLSGMSSRLFVRVREELGLAYYVGAARVTGLRAGMFYLYSGTQLATSAAVLAEFDAEIARLRAGAVEEPELARARARLKANLRVGRQSPSHRAQQAALNALYDLPVNDAKLRETAYDAADIAAVQTFAKKYLRPEARVRLRVQPKNS